MANTFILYRILGNDLPPRHGSRQTLENLRFLLDHEPEFPDLEKRWVVNRIADGEREAELIALLEERGQTYVHIPFDREVYRAYFLDSYQLPERYNPFDILGGQLTQELSGLALEWLHRDKNRYVINVNGARNAAIEDGIKAGATWIMPWDGGCFLTLSGFNGILATIVSRSDVRYVTVPMMRLTDNQVLLNPSFRPPAPTDEPQIVFHRDAGERFDEALRYGHRPKAELFVRIGIPGPWHGWPATPWEQPRDFKVVDKDRFAAGGWVARLDTQASKTVEKTDNARWIARYQGLSAHCAAIEVKQIEAVRADGPPLSCYGFLAAAKPDDATVARVAALAEPFLAMEPVSVKDRPPPAKGVDPLDYVSIGRYFHPAIDGTYVIQDGVMNPAAVRGRPEADAFDRYRLQTMIEAVTTLTIAHRLTGKAEYAAKAAAFVDRWFIDPTTRMNPHARFAQIRPDMPGTLNPLGSIDFRDLWPLTDALVMLRAAGFIDEAAEAELKRWFRAFHRHLVDRAGAAARRLNNIGAVYDLLLAAVASYIGDVNSLNTVIQRASIRIERQVRPWGWQPSETSRAMPLHYSLFGIQALIGLAEIGRANGADPWRYAAPEHRSIPMAIRFAALNRGLFADYAERATMFDDRIALARRLVPAHAADYAAIADLPVKNLSDPAALGTDEGVPPLWGLLHG